jgi:choice-of-anchor C domain-containing protein
VTLLNPGICSLTASQAGDGNYLAASPVSRTFDISTPNVIKDGSFETPAEPPGGGVEFTVGQHIGPWDVTQANVDLTTTFWQNADGAQSLDLAGLAPGAVSQTFTLQYTGAYTVKFQYAGNVGGAPVKKHMTVTANSPSWGSPVSVSKVFDTTGLSNANMGWKKGKLLFNGTAGQVITVTFTDTDGPTFYGMVIDAVAANAK